MNYELVHSPLFPLPGLVSSACDEGSETKFSPAHNQTVSVALDATNAGKYYSCITCILAEASALLYFR